MTSAPWIDGMRGASVLGVAHSLGLPTQPPRGSNGGAITSCPACAAATRHRKSHDRRGAVGVRRDGKGWQCWQCDTRGDAIDLVAHSLHGRPYRYLDPGDRVEVRAWCCTYLGIADDAPSARHRSSASPRPRRAPLRTQAQEPAPEPVRELEYPDAAELAEFWARCRPVTELRDTCAWLVRRRLDPDTIADGDFARGIPARSRTYTLPAWARFGSRGRDWAAAGYHLITPLFDAAGVMRSVVARNVIEEAERVRVLGDFGANMPKSLPPYDRKRGGLVLACHVARHLLERGELPKWREWDPRTAVRIETCEGSKKFLMRALANEANEHAPLVIGVDSGSWTQELAARIPDGSTLVVMTDQNDAGAKYATAIVRSLADRIASGAVRVELRPEFVLQRDRYGQSVVQLSEAAA